MRDAYGVRQVPRAIGAAGFITLRVMRLVAQGARLVLFALLALFEPVVRWVLSIAAFGCFATCAFYALTSPPNLQFPFMLGIALGAGCAVLLTAYELLVRNLAP